MLTILLVSTADTELLAAAASGAGYLTANPARLTADEVPALAARADLIVLRLLGGRNAWAEGVAALVAAGKPLVALGGEAAPDAELMALSTVPAGVTTEALAYLLEGEGIETGVDLEALVAVSAWLEELLGRQLEGQLYRAGVSSVSA